MCRVTISDGPAILRVRANVGETVLSVLQRTEGVLFDAPCGGNGTCGKCAVTASGAISDAGSREAAFLGTSSLSNGVRLACRARISGNCEIRLPERGRVETAVEANARPSGVDRRAAPPDPVVETVSVVLDPPSLVDSRDATKRFADALGVPEAALGLTVRERIARLPYGRALNVVRSDFGVIDVRAEGVGRLFGVAADIGTSTVVLYLVDLSNGGLIASRSGANLQVAFGADVISRIEHASRSRRNLGLLQEKISRQLQEMTEELTESQGGSARDVLIFMVAGNTTMLHLLAGVSPETMAAAPYVPAFTDALAIAARELGLRLHPNAELRFLPSVAAYVGADIVAGVLATRLDRSAGLTLLVDLGTNCEMVLGNREAMIACATAAGPAFEGARIACGVGGVPGAIRRVWCDGDLSFETIDGRPPVGICGSGILDTIALLLDAGIVDETGRMRTEEELAGAGIGSGALAGRLRRNVGGKGGGSTYPRFTLHSPTRSDRREGDSADDAAISSRGEIYFSQKDVREVQLAKAAIAAGIEVLIDRFGTSVDAIEKVYLSGSFGSSLSPRSACAIGALPVALAGRVEAIGNSAGWGVWLALRSRSELSRCSEIRRRICYVELSGDTQFRDAYVAHMSFIVPPEVPAQGSSP